MRKGIDLTSIIVPDDDIDDGDEPMDCDEEDPTLTIDVTRPWIVDEMESIRKTMRAGETDVAMLNELYVYETLSAPVVFKVGDRDVTGVILFSFDGTAEIEVKGENIRGLFKVPTKFLKIVPDILSEMNKSDSDEVEVTGSEEQDDEDEPEGDRVNEYRDELS